MTSPQNNKKQETKSDIIYKPKKKKLSTLNKVLIIISSILCFCIIAVSVLAILVHKGKLSLLDITGMQLNPDDTVSDVEIEDDGQRVVYKGDVYTYNENMTAILCMGVDKEQFANHSAALQAKGQADALFLFCMDTKTGKSTIVPIPRDTMCDIDIYSSDGKFSGSYNSQVCLAYAYGDGKHTSCQNVSKAVSRIFYGLKINSYVAVDLQVIEKITNKIGGVNITPTSNFNFNWLNLYKGNTYNLKGEDALLFVQARDKSSLTSSLDRMERQKLFVESLFKKILTQTKKDITTPVRLYNWSSKYTVTDLTISDISFLTSAMLGGTSGMGIEFKSVKGEMKMGKEYAEYHIDNTALYETILDVFYNKEDLVSSNIQ